MNPKGRELVTTEMVCAKYGIRDPGNMRDLQAIMGDAVVSEVVVVWYCCIVFGGSSSSSSVYSI